MCWGTKKIQLRFIKVKCRNLRHEQHPSFFKWDSFHVGNNIAASNASPVILGSRLLL